MKAEPRYEVQWPHGHFQLEDWLVCPMCKQRKAEGGCMKADDLLLTDTEVIEVRNAAIERHFRLSKGKMPLPEFLRDALHRAQAAKVLAVLIQKGHEQYLDATWIIGIAAMTGLTWPPARGIAPGPPGAPRAGED